MSSGSNGSQYNYGSHLSVHCLGNLLKTQAFKIRIVGSKAHPRHTGSQSLMMEPKQLTPQLIPNALYP